MMNLAGRLGQRALYRGCRPHMRRLSISLPVRDTPLETNKRLLEEQYERDRRLRESIERARAERARRTEEKVKSRKDLPILKYAAFGVLGLLTTVGVIVGVLNYLSDLPPGIRSRLRRALTQSARGNYDDADADFAGAYLEARHKARDGILGENGFMKLSGIAAKWADMWTKAGQAEFAYAVYNRLFLDFVEASGNKTPSKLELVRGSDAAPLKQPPSFTGVPREKVNPAIAAGIITQEEASSQDDKTSVSSEYVSRLLTSSRELSKSLTRAKTNLLGPAEQAEASKVAVHLGDHFVDRQLDQYAEPYYVWAVEQALQLALYGERMRDASVTTELSDQNVKKEIESTPQPRTLPSTAAGLDISSILERLGSLYSRTGKHHLALPLYIHTVASILPIDYDQDIEPQVRAHPPVVQCHAATLMNNIASSIIDKPRPTRDDVSHAVHWAQLARQVSSNAVELLAARQGQPAYRATSDECVLVGIAARYNMGMLSEISGNKRLARSWYEQSFQLSKLAENREGRLRAAKALERLGKK